MLVKRTTFRGAGHGRPAIPELRAVGWPNKCVKGILEDLSRAPTVSTSISIKLVSSRLANYVLDK